MTPYLPSVEWYRQWLRHQLNSAEPEPRLPAHFNRAQIIAPFGTQTLTVPIEGGRRLISASRYPSLRLSEHGDWRHTHWLTINTAYGSSPYFHYIEPLFEPIYSRRFTLLSELCEALHSAVVRAASLPEAINYLKANPEAPLKGEPLALPSATLSILHLLCQKGPESIFTLLLPADSHTPISNI